jgi:hypothetical protein
MLLLNDIKRVCDLEARITLLYKSNEVMERIITFSTGDSQKEANSLLKMFSTISIKLKNYEDIFHSLSTKEMISHGDKILSNISTISKLQTENNLCNNQITILDDELSAYDEEIAQLEQQLNELEIGYDVERHINNCLTQIGIQKAKNFILGQATGWCEAVESFSQNDPNFDGPTPQQSTLTLLWNSNVSQYTFTVLSDGSYNIITPWNKANKNGTSGLDGNFNFFSGGDEESVSFNPTQVNNNISSLATRQQSQSTAVKIAINYCTKIIYSVFGDHINSLIVSTQQKQQHYPNQYETSNSYGNNFNQQDISAYFSTLLTQLNLLFTRIDNLGTQLAELYLSIGCTITLGKHEDLPAVFIQLPNVFSSKKDFSCSISMPLSANYRYCDGPLDLEVIATIPYQCGTLVRGYDSNGNPTERVVVVNDNILSRIEQKLKVNLYNYEGSQRLLWLAFHAQGLLDEAIKSVIG